MAGIGRTVRRQVGLGDLLQLSDPGWSGPVYRVRSADLSVSVEMCLVEEVYIQDPLTSSRLAILVYRELESSFLALFFDVVFGITLCAMTIVAAIIITLGFMTWCSDMTERFPSCDVADGQNITNVELNIQTSGFYIEMGTAQFGAWASFAVWVGLSVFALLKLINNHQLRNMKVSMYIERQRLVNEDVYRGTTSEVPTGGDMEGGSIRGVGSPGENPID